MHKHKHAQAQSCTSTNTCVRTQTQLITRISFSVLRVTFFFFCTLARCVCSFRRMHNLTYTHTAGRAPNIKRLIASFNRMGNWVSSCIVRLPHRSKRAQAIEVFIRLAKKSRKLNNFNAVAFVVFALECEAVARLHRSWEVRSKLVYMRVRVCACARVRVRVCACVCMRMCMCVCACA